MGGDGGHGMAEDGFEIGRDRLVDVGRRDAQPAGRREGLEAQVIGVEAVGGEDLVDGGTGGAGELDPVGGGIAGGGDELELGTIDHGGKRIGLEAEPLFSGPGHDGEMHHELQDAGKVGVLGEEMDQRLIGAVEAGGDAEGGELALGGLTGGAVVEQPGLDGSGGLQRRDAVDKGVDGARRGVVGENGHLLPCGSRTSRSQSPNRLRPSTVNMMARPGNTLIHQAVCL